MALDQRKHSELTMTLGGFNAKVSNENVSAVTDGCGLGEKNNRGDKLLAWSESHDIYIYR